MISSNFEKKKNAATTRPKGIMSTNESQIAHLPTDIEISMFRYGYRDKYV